MRVGLRLRTTLMVVVLVAVGGASYALYFTQHERQLAEHARRDSMMATLSAFAMPCAIAIANDRVDQLDNLLAAVAEHKDKLELVELTVVDHRGRVLADSRVERFGQTLTDRFTREASEADRPLWQRHGSRALVSYPIVSGLRWGTLRATLSLKKMELQIKRRTRDLLLFFGAAALALGAALVILLGVLVVNPVRELAHLTRRLGEGNLHVRTHSRRRDELGDLSQSFDNMASRLAHHTEELEHTVRERTTQLAESNRRLTDINRRLETANRQLEQLAVTDGLTSLYNHRHFQELLGLELKRGSRAPHCFTVLMIDVDHFKAYNDTHGHPAGDEVLRQISAILASNLRETDVVARYGGEEFVVMLVDSDKEAGLSTAEKLRGLVEDFPFAHREQHPGGAVTISVGVAFFPDHGMTPGDLIYAADQALYASKHAGRNRVTASSSTTEEET